MRWSILNRPPAAVLMVVAVASASCASGSAGPPALAYRLPDLRGVTYRAGDTLSIGITALGQALDLTVNSTAQYDVAFARADDGVEVTLSVRELAADVKLPMADPLSVNEDIVEGDLVFTLSRRGDVTVIQSPDVEEAASPLFAGPTVAHSFFPGLPGLAVAVGDSWVDTVSYGDDDDAGESSQTSVMTYTVSGEAMVDGRSLLEITFEGTQEMRQTLTLQGAEIAQETHLGVRGRVLWDQQRALMFERETVSTGTGTVRVALAPTPLPTRVEIRSHARLQPQ